MSNKVYFSCFQTGVGGAAHYVTKRQFDLVMARQGCAVQYHFGLDIWYTWPKRMPQMVAKSAAYHAADKWNKSNRPGVTKIREAVREQSQRDIDF